jgi:hypothetical protein
MKSRLVAGVIHKRVIYDTFLLSQLASAIGWCDPHGDALFIVARTARTCL